MQIHTGFESTGEAYNASQVDDTIKDGDILVTKNGSIAILCKAWPVHVKGPIGEFHTFSSGVNWIRFSKGRYYHSYLKALSVAGNGVGVGGT